MMSSWTAQATVTASLTAFLYEGFTYNAVYLARVLPAVDLDSEVYPRLVAFNLAWGLALWSYLRTSWADPGAVPEEWHDFVRRAGVALRISPGRKEWQPGQATMCKFCSRPRPERAHHCALCHVCILRLDHHCPWINNCVGFNNHKYFIQTCFYVLLACVVAFVSAFPQLALVTQRWRMILHGGKGFSLGLAPTDEIAFIVFGAIAMFIAMFVTPLLAIQMRLAIGNRTTIEDNYGGSSNPFDQGVGANLSQLFGGFGLDWFLPVAPWRPQVDGVTFPRSDAWADEYSLMSGNGYSEEPSPTGWTRQAQGEGVWRAHYGVAMFDAERDAHTPSTLDYMLGCMQMDCEGDALPPRR
mmetsp:Transcript_115147/g.321865  ORF Transcript_115147/g.321865 Transcript_115147/m.321865 type:complete len:355 (+) Transcript_115147:146-1210(+)